jgi:hypothetical protein
MVARRRVALIMIAQLGHVKIDHVSEIGNELFERYLDVHVQ